MEPLPRTTFPARLESLGPIRACVKEAAAGAALAPAAGYQLMLAIDEIATNIILHGYQEQGLAGDLTLVCTQEEGVLRIVLEDSAGPFDPRASTLPSAEDLARPLEGKPVGGLGLYLAFNGVDRFDYRREAGRNFNSFEMNLGG